MSEKSKRNLEYHWFAAGTVSALARFIPLPLMEDIVDGRAKRYAVGKTLEFYDRTFDEEEIAILVDGGTTAFSRVARKIVRIPYKILLFPVRKLTKLATAATGVPKDFAHTFLLARALDRYLMDGRLDDKSNRRDSNETARSIRRAFDLAFANIDKIALRSLSKTISREWSDLEPTVHGAIHKMTGWDLNSDRIEKETRRMAQAAEFVVDQSVYEEHSETLSLSGVVGEFDSYFDQELSVS